MPPDQLLEQDRDPAGGLEPSSDLGRVDLSLRVDPVDELRNLPFGERSEGETFGPARLDPLLDGRGELGRQSSRTAPT